MDVSIKNIRKEFQGAIALKDVSLDIRSGELIALLGPSGSGKTTLLRLIAGLEFSTRGSIYFGGEDASAKSVRDRHIGFVFQHYALFKHMTVFDNIAFGLKVRKKSVRPDKMLIAKKVYELLELVQLQGLEKRYPSQLSGGQRQRVALARALAIDPTVLLLDEPFGALDAQVRKDLRRWLRALHAQTKHTTVFVTHDQEEALELADRVVVMSAGAIEQVGTPNEVYDHPATPFVYEFLGSANVLPVHVRDGHIRLEGFETTIATQNPNGSHQTLVDGRGELFVRPHDFELCDERHHAIPGIVRMIRSFSGMTRLEIAVTGLERLITVEMQRNSAKESAALAVGARILIRPRQFGLFPSRSDSAAKSAEISQIHPHLRVIQDSAG
ncbi:MULTISPECIES: sulfate/molybdate ABC transporter ATP-binding protein [unclassified Iodidimonas]|jgi:sulfate transport system ATP-binding protein|uniref:sulfate/molybdate ABC transporter ATP-binding protein n=1 Tax=unclassified Iodidimonas TaxID=2626145 RepID=UPI00248315FA|nr:MULTISPECIES: sulfate/molybdate ABC transporter ATP-binding protein [unclassified Iodidimonas]